ncbi:hypothetical protein EVAR_64696_1 [Eumeta japonica]|uniref:Uncharacterized protein n=1 Tax=Eumeta variegata TaxID=151549 RepID=A0A4C1ZQF1_EUMVA|nr:hypothetical protein EVAR_64696_1 [Eumeta japonica]
MNPKVVFLAGSGAPAARLDAGRVIVLTHRDLEKILIQTKIVRRCETHLLPRSPRRPDAVYAARRRGGATPRDLGAPSAHDPLLLRWRPEIAFVDTMISCGGHPSATRCRGDFLRRGDLLEISQKTNHAPLTPPRVVWPRTVKLNRKPANSIADSVMLSSGGLFSAFQPHTTRVHGRGYAYAFYTSSSSS